MNLADKIFRYVDDMLFGLNDWFGHTIYHHCRLATTDGEYELTATDGSICSVVKVHGVLELLSDDDLHDNLQQFRKNTLTRFTKTGHLLEVVLDYNTGKYVEDVIDEKLLPARITAKNMGFDIDPIFDDWGQSVAQNCAKEDLWFVLWTRPFVLPKQDAGRAKRRMRALARKTCPAVTGEVQQVGTILSTIRSQHMTFVDTILSALKGINIDAEKLDAHRALREIRQIIDHEFTSDTWRPCLPGDKLPIKYPEPEESPKDLSCMMYPSIRQQLFPREGHEIDTRILEIGDKLHYPMMLILPPQFPTAFSELFNRMKEKNIPWRICFYIDAGGLDYLFFKNMLASLLYFTSSVNKKFNKAIERLKEAELSGESSVRLKIGVSTWVNKHENDAMATLSRQAAELAGAMQAWGTSDVAEVIGSPLLGFSATLPAVMLAHPAPSCAAPLGDVLSMLPINRPSSPWADGSIMLRTPDGKIMPYHPLSSLQAAWIDIGTAPMGAGKSVWLNTINYGFIFQPGLTRLPHLSIIDMGPSSSGLINLLKSLLPPDKRHYCGYYRLKMTEEYATNPFDTPLGCQKSLPKHRAFLVNLLSLFATPLDKSAAQDGVPGIARACVEMAFDEYGQANNPKLYNRSVDVELSQLIDKLAITIDSQTSWWEIVDALFERGYVHEAMLAQRYAVPLLGEVASMARKREVQGLYNFKTPNGEPVTEFFWRSCIEAIAAYPIFTVPTAFDIGDSRVVSLDLDEVAPRGSHEANRQTAIMLMLARHIAGSKFFLMPDDVKFMAPKYKEYHAIKIKEIRRDPKRLCFDEAHRGFKNQSVVKQFVEDITTAGRESRKWNLSIGLYSQDFGDFPEIIVELATSIFILGVGTNKSADKICDLLGLNEKVKEAMINLRKPDHRGANMVVYSKTAKGRYVQLLTNTIGRQALCAFNSTSEDTTVTNKLYEEIGVTRALKIMSRTYPQGIKKEVERRRLKVQLTCYQENVDYLDEIASELIAESRMLDLEGVAIR